MSGWLYGRLKIEALSEVNYHINYDFASWINSKKNQLMASMYKQRPTPKRRESNNNWLACLLAGSHNFLNKYNDEDFLTSQIYWFFINCRSFRNSENKFATFCSSVTVEVKVRSSRWFVKPSPSPRWVDFCDALEVMSTGVFFAKLANIYQQAQTVEIIWVDELFVATREDSIGQLVGGWVYFGLECFSGGGKSYEIVSCVTEPWSWSRLESDRRMFDTLILWSCIKSSSASSFELQDIKYWRCVQLCQLDYLNCWGFKECLKGKLSSFRFSNVFVLWNKIRLVLNN